MSAHVAGELLAAGVAGLGIGVGLVLGIALIRRIHRELDDGELGAYRCATCGARFDTVEGCVDHAATHRGAG